MSVKRVMCLPSQYLKRAKGDPLPICFMNYLVTLRCIAKCKMCNIWKNQIQDDELTVKEIKEVFSSPILSSLDWLQLSGGEPFLRDDLTEIIQTISQLHPNLSIYIATNGFLTNRIIETVMQAMEFNENLMIGVSIDGIGPLHDTVRGTKGAFNMALKTIESLKDLGVKINLGMTVLPCNFTQISQVRELAKSYGAEFGFQITENQQAYFSNTENSEIQFTKETKKEMIDFIAKQAKKERWYYENSRLFKAVLTFKLDSAFKHAEQPDKQIIPCFSGIHSLLLDPFGTVYPCTVLNSALGNIRQKSLQEIWLSENAKIIRKSIAKGRCPSCWLNCENGYSITKSPHKLAPYFIKTF